MPSVSDNAPHPDGFLATRLDHLFRTVHPGRARPWTPAHVAEAINNSAGGEQVTSGTYLWQLKTGRRDNPTYKLLIGLSRFFGVSPAFFFDEAELDRGAIPAEVALALRDDAVRDIALRSAGLSERSRKVIADTITGAQAEEAPRPRPRPKPRPAPAKAPE
jgi:transcriptional regulator with XRE-family HTH domain